MKGQAEKNREPKKSRHYMKEKSLDTANQIIQLIDQGLSDEEIQEVLGVKRRKSGNLLNN